MTKPRAAVWSRLCALLLSIVMLFGMFSALSYGTFAVEEENYASSKVISGSITSPGKVLVREYNLYDKDGTVRKINSGKDYEASIKDLTTNLDNGKIAASKDGYFETVEDAQNRIVKLVFDVAGAPSSEPVDVMFVVDESGSMNMYSDLSVRSASPEVKNNNSSYTVPCMNKDHYYMIQYTVKRENGSNLSTQNQYYFCPADCPNMNVWYSGAVSTAFIADIKKGIVADPTSAGYGLPVSRITLEKFGGQWDFGDHHYKKGEDGSWVKIDKYRGSFSYTYSNGATTTDNGHDYSKNTPAITGDYYSPPLDNANGCVDRLILAKNEIKKMSETVMKNNSKSAIAWTSFGGELTSWGDFASATPDELIHSLNGYDNTNYVVGLDKAYELLAARKASTDPKIKNRTTFVVFITDGIPNKPGEGNKNVTIVDENGNTSVVNMSVPAAEAVEAAQEIKGISDTIEFYCAGINSGASDTLKYMAKSDSYYKDCKTGDDFKEFLSKITLAANASATVLLDVLGDAYNLVCDSDHKITVRDGSTEHAFSSLSSAIEGGVDFNDPELSWRLNEVTDAGARLSFYVKLDDAMYDSFTASGEGAYQTNKSATLTYHRVIDGTESSVVETIPFDNPATLKIKRSVLTAVKSSDKNEQTVKTGDNIKYTITLNNTGLVDINNVKVSDAVPQESEFVSAENGGTLTDGRVNFTVSSIPAGKTATVSFTVKVLRGNKDIVNHAMFGTEDAADSIGSTGIPVCYTNEVKNPRAYHLLSFSKTVRGNLGDPYKEFEFTVVCKDADGNALPAGIDILFTKSTAGSTDEPEEGTTATDANGQIKFTLRHGQSISFKDVPVGIIEVAEANVSDYTTTYRDSKTGESKVASAGSTGEIGITQYETRSFDFYNVKTMAPPTGAAISVRNTILLMATALLVMAAAWKISAFRRKKRQ